MELPRAVFQRAKSHTTLLRYVAAMLPVGPFLRPERHSLCRLRGLLGGDDLVGGAAGQLGHVVELRRERADTGGRRGHLDDEVAALGLAHHRLHGPPAAPAVTRVEAEDLPA